MELLVEKYYGSPDLADFVFGPRLGKSCRALRYSLKL